MDIRIDTLADPVERSVMQGAIDGDLRQRLSGGDAATPSKTVETAWYLRQERLHEEVQA